MEDLDLTYPSSLLSDPVTHVPVDEGNRRVRNVVSEVWAGLGHQTGERDRGLEQLQFWTQLRTLRGLSLPGGLHGVAESCIYSLRRDKRWRTRYRNTEAVKTPKHSSWLRENGITTTPSLL